MRPPSTVMRSAAVHDKAELERLARNRHQKTSEIHPPNDFYGHAAVLKKFAGLPSSRALRAVVEHGIVPFSHVWDIDVRAPFATFFCAGDERVRAYEAARPGGTGIAIGPMIHYAGDAPPQPRRAGELLVFPVHSTHHVRSRYDIAEFARTVAGYRDRFGVVTVCLGWRDVLDGVAAPYLAEGFRCATAGHMFDPEFLPRLRRLIESADTVLSNRFGTHVSYSVALGRPVWLLPQEISSVGKPKLVGHWREDDTAAVRDLQIAFQEEVDEVLPDQLARLQPFTGFDCVRKPNELGVLIAEAGERYRSSTHAGRRAGHWLIGRVARPLAARARLPR